MGFSKRKALEVMGDLISNYCNDETWCEIIKLMDSSGVNFSPYMIYGQGFDSFNTINLLDINRDLNLGFLHKEELLEFLTDDNFIVYLDLYKIYCDNNNDNYIEDFNFFIKEIKQI